MTTPATNNTTNVWASVQNDKGYDRIPVVSTLTNARDLIEKAKMAWNRAYPPKVATTPPPKPLDLDQQHYYRHLREKSVFRCVVAMVPVLGNLCIWLYNQWSQDYGNFNKMVALIEKQKTNSGVVDTFKKASLELRCDQKFIKVVEAQLIANLNQSRSEYRVINFTDLLTYAGDEVTFSKALFGNNAVDTAVWASMNNLKYEELPKKYQQVREICEALRWPKEFRKIDPSVPGYLDIAQKAIKAEYLNLGEFARKVVLDYSRDDHKQFLAAIAQISPPREDWQKWCDNFGAGLFALQTSTEALVNNRAWMVDLVAHAPGLLEMMTIHATRHGLTFPDLANDGAFMEAVVKKNPAAAMECGFDVVNHPAIRDALANTILKNGNILEKLHSAVKTPEFLAYVAEYRKKHSAYDKMVALINMQETNIGVIDIFTKASPELRCNQDFIDAVELRLMMNQHQTRPEDKVINFTDLLTYTGYDVAFSSQIMNRDNFAAAVKHNKDFLKLEALGEQYEKGGIIYEDFCSALCEACPMEFVKVDPEMLGYSTLAASCITKDPKIFTEFAKKYAFDLLSPRHISEKDMACLHCINELLVKKLEKREDITPWVEGLFLLKLGISNEGRVSLMEREKFIRDNANELPVLLDYRIYECAGALNLRFENWPQNPEFMASLVRVTSSNSVDSKNVDSYFLARYCDFDVLGLPQDQTWWKLIEALRNLGKKRLLRKNELSPRLCTNAFLGRFELVYSDEKGK